MKKISEIEKRVDSLGSHSRGRRGKVSRKMLAVTAIIIGCFVITASGALLSYYGKVTTSMNAEQSIVISDGVSWRNWNEPIERNLGNVVHCTDYTYKLWIKNRACVSAEVSFTDSPNPESTGIAINHYVFGDDQTIELRQKDSSWAVINEGEMGADITFNTCGTTFDYSINYWGITGDYSLVYYLDHYPRFEDWGHVYVIDSLQSTGNINIPAIPFVDDWNAGPDANYGTSPDYYEHIRGAKLWIVPTSNLVNPALMQETTLNAWTPTEYLFETDLALYIDCDDMTPPYLEYVYPLFDTDILQSESTYCWISCYHVAFNIAPGNYNFVTTLNALPN